MSGLVESDELVEAVARAAADDPDARLIARTGETVCFDGMDPETQEFWCCIARAALAVAEPAIRADEREKAARALEETITRGYLTPPRKVDQCEHGRFGWEDCIACYDEALSQTANAIRAGQGERG